MPPPHPFCRCHQLWGTIAVENAYLLLGSHEIIESKAGLVCAFLRRRVASQPTHVGVVHDDS